VIAFSCGIQNIGNIDTILTEGRNLDFHGMEKIEKESLLMWHNSLNDFAMIISAS